VIDLNNITKQFEDTTALENFSLSFVEGKTTALIGPSGCGKSTILRIIVGLVQAEEGSVELNKNEILTQGINDFRHRLGYVIQDGGLFTHMTARENIILMAKHLSWANEKINDRLALLMEMFHLDNDMMERYPLELSGGQQQRISLMRALMLDPDLLLLDEPLGALDPMIRFDLQQELKSIFNELNKTVILVTHDIAEAAFFADEIVLMREGNIVQQGTIQELISSPEEKFVTAFITAQKSHWKLLESGQNNVL
jgi:osmoprotectant transport system ATP-binding protein